MKINEAGMNALILGLPLGGVLTHAGPSVPVAEPPPNGAPDAQTQSAQALPSRNPARPIQWLAMGICVAAAAWMVTQGGYLASPVPETKVTTLPEQPHKVERTEVPALEPLPPLTKDWPELPAEAATAQNESAPAHSVAAEDRKQVAETRPVQKKAAPAAPQHNKVHSDPAVVVTPRPTMPPAAAMPKEARQSAVAPVPEKIDGAAIGIISTSNDKLVMSVDGSFRIFRPGDRLPFNEVLVSVRNGRITTDKRAIELVQQP